MADHFEDSASSGLGFLAATVLLSALAVSVTRFPASRIALAATAAVFVGLLASYALAVTNGVAVLHRDRQPVDGLALFTKAVEVVGLLAISTLLWQPAVAANIPQPKGMLT